MNIPIIQHENMSDYLTLNPNVTFNKEVYRKYTNFVNKYDEINFVTSDGLNYSIDNICNNNFTHSYIGSIKLFTNDNSLQVENITHVEVLLKSNTSTTIIHSYSGLTLKAILLSTQNINEFQIELPFIHHIFIDKFLNLGYKIELNVKTNKFNLKPCAIINYVKLLDEDELIKISHMHPNILTRHIIDEIFNIEKGINTIKLTPENMQCCLIFFTFSPNIKNIEATLKIANDEYAINKWTSNRMFSGIENCPNVMIFEVFKNIQEFYNFQPSGNILLDGNATLTFESNEIGYLTVGYVLLDLLQYSHNAISFFDMKPIEINKTKSIKYVTISK